MLNDSYTNTLELLNYFERQKGPNPPDEIRSLFDQNVAYVKLCYPLVHENFEKNLKDGASGSTDEKPELNGNGNGKREAVAATDTTKTGKKSKRPRSYPNRSRV